NMLLLNGKKMSKSDGNSITPAQLFSGESEHVTQGYSPMILRFFMLQSHYRSTMDLTNDALLAAEKGYHRLMEAWRNLESLVATGKAQNETVGKTLEVGLVAAYAEMDNDFNTPKALARVFELVSKINALKGGQLSLDEVSPESLDYFKAGFKALIFDVFGLLDETTGGGGNGKHHAALDGVMNVLLDIRQQARADKNWGLSDQIRDALKEAGISVKDGKEGATWSV
ncbi:MAG: DALR domain-containing protein, partial [Bacteroidota bacterium]